MENKYVELFQKILPKISIGSCTKGFGVDYDIRNIYRLINLSDKKIIIKSSLKR